jgi:putative acyl-CoA dehydrogenase
VFSFLYLALGRLVRHAPRAVADAFRAARLGADGGRAYGTLPSAVDSREIVTRELAT